MLYGDGDNMRSKVSKMDRAVYMRIAKGKIQGFDQVSSEGAFWVRQNQVHCRFSACLVGSISGIAILDSRVLRPIASILF